MMTHRSIFVQITLTIAKRDCPPTLIVFLVLLGFGLVAQSGYKKLLESRNRLINILKL